MYFSMEAAGAQLTSDLQRDALHWHLVYFDVNYSKSGKLAVQSRGHVGERIGEETPIH